MFLSFHASKKTWQKIKKHGKKFQDYGKNFEKMAKNIKTWQEINFVFLKKYTYRYNPDFWKRKQFFSVFFLSKKASFTDNFYFFYTA